MGAPLPLSVTRGQPQQVVKVRERWRKRGLKFAFLPPVGFVNLADGAPALQVSGPLLTSATSSGIAHAGGRAEFGAQFPATKGLTIISIWRSRVGFDYQGADSYRNLASNRTTSNTGWTYGHGVAVGGASNGNLVPQSITFQGNQQYTEGSATIESRIDTPVACRWDPVANKISWFRFGAKSSTDTTPTANPSVGGNLVFGAQGDFSSNGSPWLDRDTATLIFDGALTDAEIAELTATTANVWQAFELSGFSMPLLAALTSTVSTGGGTTVTGSLAWAEANDGSAISATETDRDTIAWTEADDASALSGTLTDRAALSWSEADDMYSALVTETDRESFAWTEPDDVWALTAAQTDRAALAWTEDNDAQSITASDAAPTNVSGSIAWTEQDDAFSLFLQAATGGAPGYDVHKPKRRYVVRKNGELLVFSDPELAKQALHADDEPPVKQYPAKKQAKAAPKLVPVRESNPVPEQRVDLAEIQAMAARQHAQAEYQALMAQKRYEALLMLLERLREEEEDDWLLMAAD